MTVKNDGILLQNNNMLILKPKKQICLHKILSRTIVLIVLLVSIGNFFQKQYKPYWPQTSEW